MSIRLCQECSQWVSTRDGRCPDCQEALPERVSPDETDTRFRSLVGEGRRRIGQIRIVRRSLPTDGFLYETANGLFFLPDRSLIRRRLVEQPASSPLWSLASVLWAPLMFVSPFLNRRELREKDTIENVPIRLEGEDLQLLPDFLSRTSGAFFLPARNIRMVRQKRNRWIVERVIGSNIAFQPIVNGTFSREMQRFLESRLLG